MRLFLFSSVHSTSLVSAVCSLRMARFAHWVVSISVVILWATTGCLGEVGGERKPGTTGSGSASGSSSEPPTGPCTKLEKSISIRSAADMAALPRTGCYDILGKLTLQGSSITSLAGLDDINSVDELELANTGLTAIDTKRPLGIFGRLTVTGNAKLQNLQQLSFEIPSTGILIDDNDALTSLDALDLDDPKLERVNGDLVITGNAALPAVSLPKLGAVTGALTITGNGALKTIDLSKLAATGSVEVADNPQLGSLTGLAVANLNGDLAIHHNNALTTIGAMSSLYRVTGNLTIDSNPALGSLAAFTTSIQFVDHALTITNNQSLTDLGALKYLKLVGAVAITNNKNLVSCRALEIDRCVPHPLASVITTNKDGTCTAICE